MQNWPADKRVVIHPGGRHIDRGEIMISTLLGSCVAVCMYDPVLHVVGMNHFLLANNRYARKDPPVLESEAGRYGIHAMELLLEDMFKAGAKREHLRAKVFGGGNVLPSLSADGDSFFAVGEVNCRFILAYLEQENIPIVAQGLGGDYGRIIHFISTDYSVYVKRIKKARTIEVEKMEKQYWRESIDERSRKESVR